MKKYKQEISSTLPEETVLNRRELLKKYGAYTAPTLVSLVLSSEAQAANGGVVYSSLQLCLDAHSMQGIDHCEDIMAMHLTS
ncbi:MAG TPA: hypothetical protein DCY55_04090 [Gammaproteobacteria bacterium]|nr:hypothetical protein [Gammaproteobacteria bacterium]